SGLGSYLFRPLKLSEVLSAYTRNNAATAVCGAPGITIPIGGGAKGLPAGLELDGQPGGDLTLLAIAKEVEQTLRASGSLGD
ncbi:hypothetical protein MO867_20360, partial [Microbulbifer sp. OS29]|nr:hypothetical protein [Microbulbifer okhotskensis]